MIIIVNYCKTNDKINEIKYKKLFSYILQKNIITLTGII